MDALQRASDFVSWASGEPHVASGAGEGGERRGGWAEGLGQCL